MLPLKLSEIARLVGGELIGEIDLEITGLAGLGHAGPQDLSFIKDASGLSVARQSSAGALLVGPDFGPDVNSEVEAIGKPCIRVGHPYRVFAELLAGQLIPVDRVFPVGVHPTAVIDASADVSGAVAIGAYTVIAAGVVLGSGTRLGPQVTIGCDVELGRDCTVYPQVVVREGCRLGDRVIVHSAAVIGGDGFGYLPSENGLQKIPQVGIVVLADDVEIGVGVTIDRATTGQTLIGAGTKLDNQVQIAHNVTVGAHCALSAQVGIAGSCTLGDGVIAGGQVGIGDHITIGAGSELGGQAGVISDLAAGSRVFGTPALDVKESFRTAASLRRMPELKRTVTALNARVEALALEIAELKAEAAASTSDEEN